MGSYALLFAISMLLNLRDGKMLLLTFIVGCGIFFPIPDIDFYVWCISIEILVYVMAKKINARGSVAIQWLSGLLALWHILGLIYDGSSPNSPYGILVKFSEHAELIMLIILSKPIFGHNKKETSHV